MLKFVKIRSGLKQLQNADIYYEIVSAWTKFHWIGQKIPKIVKKINFNLLAYVIFRKPGNRANFFGKWSNKIFFGLIYFVLQKYFDRIDMCISRMIKDSERYVACGFE